MPARNITLCESRQTSLWSFRARRFDEPTQVAKQMITETTETRVSDPLLVQPSALVGNYIVHRLQIGIAQVTHFGGKPRLVTQA